MTKNHTKSNSPGRPRKHEVGKWTAVQFRLPIEWRNKLLQLLEKKNESLSYHLSLNSFLLELLQNSLEQPYEEK